MDVCLPPSLRRGTLRLTVSGFRLREGGGAPPLCQPPRPPQSAGTQLRSLSLCRSEVSVVGLLLSTLIVLSVYPSWDISCVQGQRGHSLGQFWEGRSRPLTSRFPLGPGVGPAPGLPGPAVFQTCSEMLCLRRLLHNPLSLPAHRATS